MKTNSRTKLLLGVILASTLLTTCGREGPEAPPDLIPPQVTSTSPYYQEQDVPINTGITIKFNELMNKPSLNAQSLLVQNAGASVSGTVSCSGSTAVFKPDQNLSPNSVYTVIVSADVKDFAGNALAAPYLYSFTTGTRTTVGTHTVTVAPPKNGSVTPDGKVNVNDGETRSFTLAPDPGYHIGSMSGCGGSLSGAVYTTAPITADCTVTATFTADGAKTFTVTARVSSGNGGITPGSSVVGERERASFTVSPDSGWHISSVSGCGGSLSGAVYTTGPVTADCTVTAVFSVDAPETHTVTARVSSGSGSITPGSATVSDGETASFTVTPDSGWRIASVSGCGGSLTGTTTYRTGPVTGPCQVTASFELAPPPTYTITAEADSNGTIIPSGAVRVTAGASQRFDIRTDGVFIISSVEVDGAKLDIPRLEQSFTYTFINVNRDHKIRARFKRFWKIEATIGGSGSIVPSGTVNVVEGEEQPFDMVPDTGFDIAEVFVDGTPVGPVAQYVFPPVYSDHTIRAFFDSEPAAAGARKLVSLQEVTGSAPAPGRSCPASSMSGGGPGTDTAAGRAAAAAAGDGTLTASIGGRTGPVTVTPSPGENGQILPADPQSVPYNAVVKFTVLPSEGYSVVSVTGCGGTLAENVYTTGRVTEDCTVSAVFSRSLAI